MAVDRQILREVVGILGVFWKKNLSYVPDIVECKDNFYDECLPERKILISRERYERWGKKIALEAGESRAAEWLFLGHAVSHFFGYESNPTLYYNLINPPSDEIHLAVMEAVANYPTKLLLEKKNFNSDRIMGAWYNSWDSESKPLSQKILKSFCKQGIENFLRFVASYNPKDGKTYSHLL